MTAATLLPLATTEGAIQQLVPTAEAVIIDARLTTPTVPCPCCGVAASRRQSQYQRTLADLPWQGVPVRVRLVVRRFWCDNPACPRVIFAERVPTLATPYARKTQRLLAVLTQLGFALGGEGGRRLLTILGMPASGDTLLRLVRRAVVVPAATPTAIGIDDFALRRGRRYGTLIIDLATHRPVEVLPARSADAVAVWLRAHPGVTTVARDRSGVYADGIRQGAPAATQVADRWHLLKNVGDLLERVVARHGSALRAAARPTSPDEPVPEGVAATSVGPEVANPPVPPPLAPPRRGVADAHRQDRLAAMHALQQAGRSVSAIGRELGLSRPTVRKYLRAGACPVRTRHSRLLGPGSPHVAYLRERWAAGCDNAALLWQELRARGFTGSAGSVRRFLGTWRTTPRRPGRQPRPAGGHTPPPPSPSPSPRQVRWWLLQEPEQRPADRQAYLARLLQDCPTLQAASALAREFGRLLRQRDAAAFDPWLAQAAGGDIAEFRSCAKSMRQDYAAVAAALREPYSNGPTEGNVTRLKLVKRQMYGRAKPDLLRQRVLHRAS